MSPRLFLAVACICAFLSADARSTRSLLGSKLKERPAGVRPITSQSVIYTGSGGHQAKEVFHQTLDSVYTTAGISRHPNKTNDPTFSFATWLKTPVIAEAFDLSGESLFVFESSNQAAQFDHSMARHIDAPSVGDVDMIVAEYAPWNRTCFLFGFATTGPRVGKGPLWTYSIPQCFTDATGGELTNVLMSDDGSTAALVVSSNITDGKVHGSPSAQVHVLDGQTGKVLFVFDSRADGKPPSGMHVSMSRHGEYIAFNNDVSVYVLERATGKLRTNKPVIKDSSNPAHVCPMGVFITYGFLDAYVLKWNATTKEYPVVRTLPGFDEVTGTQWYVWTSSTTVNGGGSAADGCLVAFGWSDPDVRQIRVDVLGMFSGKHYWTWFGPIDSQVQSIPMVSLHVGYLAVSHWGADDGVTPSVLLFDVNSPVPLASFVTPGSMYDVHVLAYNAPLPPMLSEGEGLWQGAGAPQPGDIVYVTAAGKHVHATTMGSGGDAYVWMVRM